MSVLQKLTEGIVDRDLAKEGAGLLNKWEQTGLLEGLDNDRKKNYMSRLLENQAKELLREASTMAAADVEGFASVAFPIVRRVFGGLIANDLVSVQPMSLPSGLIFFMDFTVTNNRSGLTAGESVYGGGKVGSELVADGATDLTENGGGFYNLQSGYSSPTGSANGLVAAVTVTASLSALTDAEKAAIHYDADVLAATGSSQLAAFTLDLGTTNGGRLNRDNLIAIDIENGLSGNDTLVRRLTTIAGNVVTFYVTNNLAKAEIAATNPLTCSLPIKDTLTEATALGAVVGANPWELENQEAIPEIDIKVDSIAVTAVTKKLKAKWSPELGSGLECISQPRR